MMRARNAPWLSLALLAAAHAWAIPVGGVAGPALER